MNEKIETSKAQVSSYLYEEIFKRHDKLIARIHSVFANGFNVQFKDQLIFVGYQRGNLSAMGIIIETPLLKDVLSRITAGDQVRIQIQRQDDNRIDLGWTLYSRPHTKSFTLSNLTFVETHVPHIELNTLLKSQLLAVLEAANVWSDTGFAKSSQLQDYYDHLMGQFEIKRLRSLIGAGMGLTPSGDDLLQGMILIEQVTQKEPVIQRAVTDLLTERSTTDVSRAYYDALFKGYVNESWIKLLKAVEQDDRPSIEGCIREIRKYGATSGNDILFGVQSYLLLKLKEN